MSIGNSLSNKIKKKGNPLSYIKNIVNSISTSDFVESDILAMITSLKNSSSGHDNIPSMLLKKSTNRFVRPLTKLINWSIKSGVENSKSNSVIWKWI